MARTTKRNARSLAELRHSAADVLSRYTDLSGLYSFATYDDLGDPEKPLSPADVLMANLLSLRLGWREVIPLFSTHPEQADARELRHRLDSALVTLRDAAPFEEHSSLESLESTLVPLAEANTAAVAVPNWTYVTVSKVLHRRLPHIVPVIDSRVRTFYAARGPESVRAALWHDMQGHRDWLAEVAGRHQTPDRRPMSLLRCADILIWSAT